MIIEFETTSEYFSYLSRNYPEELVVNEYKSSLLSIEDMRTVFAQRENDRTHVCYNIDLKKDEKTGLLYTDYDFIKGKDLLVGHLLIEQLYAQKDRVDWARVTYTYDYEAIERIKHMLITPLVWVPTEEAAEYCVVSGKVAKEIDTPIGYENEDRYQFCRDLSAQGILWFADNLPEYNEQNSMWRYHNMLPKIVLWDKLLQSSFKHFRSSEIIKILKYIANERGVARVETIVERFRKDWPYIEKKGLFGISGLDEWEKKSVLYNKDTFLDEIVLHIAEWKSAEVSLVPVTPSDKPALPKIEPSSPMDRAIKAVYDANLCKSPDWAAVIRIFREGHLRQDNGLDVDADYINAICGEIVTNKKSLERAFIVDSVEGTFPRKNDKDKTGWKIKTGLDNPKSKSLFKRYLEIGEKVVSILDE